MKQFLFRALAPAAMAAFVCSQPAVALEPLTATGLIEACKSHEVDRLGSGATTCRAYIQGYISASTEIVASEDRPSDFVARAIRTRASRLSEDAEQRLSSRYCLPQSETIDTLIGKVANASQPLAEEATAESVLLAIFDNHYRCNNVIEK